MSKIPVFVGGPFCSSMASSCSSCSPRCYSVLMSVLDCSTSGFTSMIPFYLIFNYKVIDISPTSHLCGILSSANRSWHVVLVVTSCAHEVASVAQLPSYSPSVASRMSTSAQHIIRRHIYAHRTILENFAPLRAALLLQSPVLYVLISKVIAYISNFREVSFTVGKVSRQSESSDFRAGSLHAVTFTNLRSRFHENSTHSAFVKCTF